MNHLTIFVAQYLIFLLPVLLIVILLRLPKVARIPFLMIVVSSSIFSLAGIWIASHLFYDPRPFVSSHVIPLFSHAPDNGFPSDHMTIGTMLALIGYSYSKKIGIVMICIAAAVGTARVIAHVHSWIDILGGIAVALLAVLIASAVSHYVYKEWQMRSSVLKTK